MRAQQHDNARPEKVAATPPISPDPEADDLLLRFVAERDIDCPRCGYNVRRLTRPICPECEEPLTLALKSRRMHIGWLMTAVAPGFFSGIAAVLLLIPLVMQSGGGGVPAEAVLLLLFGFGSGIVAVVLSSRYRRFIRLSEALQAGIATIIWIIHVGAFGLMMLVA